MVRRRATNRPRDAGVTLIELVAGMAVAMIGLALMATVLTTAQRQERLTTENARAVDEARLAMSFMAGEIREARGLYDQGADAAAWFDTDRDGVQDTGEVHVYGIRADGDLFKLVREIDATSQTLLEGITGGTLTVSIQKTGMQLAMSVTLPDDAAGRGGITLTSKVVNRGNG